ncbi:unnamed protein product [Rangifer tarandus platyrhynchus]|uniref:Uncharacterized protein n=1 Tax=Rangifer tarandus platyrhynchus TaxID=3082113 RepID=A0ABN8Z3H7_RANTA|nr:unnamed protein product [Rangifer tarandus platyrhynchus]
MSGERDSLEALSPGEDEAAAARPQCCLPVAPLQLGQLKLLPESQLQEEPRPSRWERNPGAWAPTAPRDTAHTLTACRQVSCRLEQQQVGRTGLASPKGPRALCAAGSPEPAARGCSSSGTRRAPGGRFVIGAWRGAEAGHIAEDGQRRVLSHTPSPPDHDPRSRQTHLSPGDGRCPLERASAWESGLAACGPRGRTDLRGEDDPGARDGAAGSSQHGYRLPWLRNSFKNPAAEASLSAQLPCRSQPDSIRAGPRHSADSRPQPWGQGARSLLVTGGAFQVKKFKNLPPPPFPAQWESKATPSPATGRSQQLPAAQARLAVRGPGYRD